MKPRHPLLPYGLLLAGWAAFVAYVWITSRQLPARVDTHFGPGGEPNGWQTHSGYLHFTLFFGTAVPAFVLAVLDIGESPLSKEGFNSPRLHFFRSAVIDVGWTVGAS